jgi:hypothetical protein
VHGLVGYLRLDQAGEAAAVLPCWRLLSGQVPNKVEPRALTEVMVGTTARHDAE